MKIAVVTTFHEAGLKKYGQRMINTFCENWPEEVTLNIYPEKCNPVIRNHGHITLTSLDDVKELTAFKEKWKNVPKANGDVSADPVRGKRKDAAKEFKWHAIRFAHKVYSIFDCAKYSDADFLVWMDADTVCHSPITINEIIRLIPADKDLCFLGRKGKYSECGLYAMNLKSPATREFLKEFQRVYDEAENGIFQLDEWHDSFVFDAVRLKFPNLRQLDWAAHLSDIRPHKGNSAGEGHPLINSEWGEYLDHLKGDDRKAMGHSKAVDLKAQRNSKYWNKIL
tara:strand:+ start:13634 stop:14479 length:846 start_codon:yes stop_codon:yes gene_type:complete